MKKKPVNKKNNQASKQIAEKLVDVILKKLPREGVKVKTKRPNGQAVDRMTEKLVKILNRVDAVFGPLQGSGETGACCIDGSCAPNLSQANCETVDGGIWKGAGSQCGAVTCSH